VPDEARVVCATVKSMEPPPQVVSYVTRYGGKNLFGEPHFRIVWGGNRTAFKTRRFEDKGPDGRLAKSVIECRETLKYPRFKEHWVLEWWKSPLEFCGGDKEMWVAANTSSLDGMPIPPREAFPSRGSYEFLTVFTGDDGEEYAAPEIGTAKHAIDCFRYLRSMTRSQFNAQKASETAALEEAELQTILDQVKDATKPSAHQAWVSLAH
jgi:hypothetical protein